MTQKALAQATTLITYEQIYHKYNRLVWHVARTVQYSYKLQEQDVEDIVGHTFQKIMTIPLERLDHRGEGGYVRMVINNSVRTELDRIARSRKLISFESPIPSDSHQEFTPTDFEDPTQQTEQNLINRDLLTKYLDILATDEKTMAVLYLGLYGNPPLSIYEISCRIKKPQKQIRSTLEATFARMRELIAEEQ